MRTLLKTAVASDFLRNNAIYFAGSMMVAFLNYLYHPVLSRFLSVRSFGEAQVIISLSGSIAIVLGVLGTVALNIFSNRETEPGREKALADLQSLGYWACAVAVAAVIAFRERAMAALQFDSPIPFVILAAILATSVPIAFRRSYLQANKDFTGVSVSSAVVAAGKILFAVLLIAAGLDIVGAVGGLLVAQIAGIAYLVRKTRGAGVFRFKALPEFNSGVRRELRYGTTVFLATGFMAFVTSMDVVFAKLYFDPEAAGLYSGISTVARIIYFATGSIAGVLIASVKIGGGRENSRTLLKAAALLAGLGGTILAGFAFFPDFFVDLFLGEKFVGFAWLLPRLSVATFLASVANLLFFYFLAVRDNRLGYAAVAGAAAAIYWVSGHHDSPQEIVNAFILGSACSAIILLALLLARPKHGSFNDTGKSQDGQPRGPDL